MRKDCGMAQTNSGKNLAIGIMAVVTGVASGLLAASDYTPVLEPVADGAPVLLVMSLLVLAAALTSARSAFWLIPAAAAVCIAGSRLAPEIAGEFQARHRPQASSSTLKVITANLLSSNYHPSNFLKMVADEKPEILILQEAGFLSWLFDGMAPEGESGLAADYRVVSACLYKSDCNVTILSRLAPKTSRQNYSHSTAVVDLRLTDALGGETIRVASLHLSRDANRDEWSAEIRDMRQRLGSMGPLDIVAGDINTVPWSARARVLDGILPIQRRTHLLASWPSPQVSALLPPLLPIDHVYAGCAWRTVETRRGAHIGSDHYPIVAVFERESSQSCSDSSIAIELKIGFWSFVCRGSANSTPQQPKAVGRRRLTPPSGLQSPCSTATRA